MTKLCPRGKAQRSENLKSTQAHMRTHTLAKFVQVKLKIPLV
jgi:hypothetical protein